jgi:hypothetical protein
MFVRNDGGMQQAGFNEHNDCAVRALATFKNIPYKQAHNTFKQHGRKDCKATPIPTIIKILGEPVQDNRMTLNNLIGKYPKGRIYAIKRGHALAVVDGVIHDTWKVGLKSRINHYWIDNCEPAQPRINTALIDKKAAAQKIYNELYGTMSGYAIAKQIAAQLGITVANANYYVSRVFNR